MSLLKAGPALSLSPLGLAGTSGDRGISAGLCPAGSDCPHGDSTTILGNLGQCLAVFMDNSDLFNMF